MDVSWAFIAMLYRGTGAPRNFAQGIMVKHTYITGHVLPKNNLKHGDPIAKRALENCLYIALH